jgi:xanthine dehydrogenase accessory factor
MSAVGDPLHATARAWCEAGRDAWIVEVLQARGSTPREAGARMLVAADSTAGTVGGGHLEFKAIATARECLAAGDTEPVDLQFALGPSLGQCCGGAVTLRLQPLNADTLAAWPAPPARFTLQLYGAGHVGHAVVRLLATLPCRVQWIDERDEAFGAEALPPHIERLAVDAPEAEIAHAPRGGWVLVMTHDHALDLRIVDAALRRPDLGFVGLIGSASKRARFEHRLLERGLSASSVQRLVSPIGVPGIEGKQPEVIAVSVVAQLLQRSSF